MRRYLVLILAIALLTSQMGPHVAHAHSEHMNGIAMTSADEGNAADCGTECDMTDMVECCSFAVAHCASTYLAPGNVDSNLVLFSLVEPFDKNFLHLSSFLISADPPPPRS